MLTASYERTTMHQRPLLVVATVDSRMGWERVHNFSVGGGNANYFVGNDGVGVHNNAKIHEYNLDSGPHFSVEINGLHTD